MTGHFAAGTADAELNAVTRYGRFGNGAFLDCLCLASRDLTLVGVHEAMEAILAERSGIGGLWLSGLSLSSMVYSMPDVNFLTTTDALGAAERVGRAKSLPVLADCDNGFRGMAQLLRTVREYEDSGVTGICVEDNAFPKTNSLYEGSEHMTCRLVSSTRSPVGRTRSPPIEWEPP